MQQHELLKWIRTAAELWVSNGNNQEEPIDVQLQEQGCDRELASIIVDYLPIAMSEPVLAELGVERLPTYDRNLTNGTQVECRWADDPIYQAVCQFRDKEAAERWSDYEQIASCSADLIAIGEALDNGNDVEGAVVAVEPVTELAPDSPWLPVKMV